jgi:hypothetical protein
MVRIGRDWGGKGKWRGGKRETYLAFDLDLFFVAVGGVPLGQAGFAPEQEEVSVSNRSVIKLGGQLER